MPGAASLAAGRYYAHPRNAFWLIVGALCGVAPSASYEERLAALVAHGIALWDVLQACERQGSLDAAIDLATAATNDFAAFFRAHPRIAVVACNGGTAYDVFCRRVVPTLASPPAVQKLPSTSPAHAGVAFAAKQEIWRRALQPCLR
jgi:hypoxanthine-DNA glycosylase